MGSKTSKQPIYSIYDETSDSTCFEDLCNELVYEIFDYLSYHDIFYAFDTLNRRFHKLVDNYPHYVNLQQHNENDTLPLSKYIHSLKINARYQFSFVNFTSLSSLRYLSISNICIRQLFHVLNIIPLQELECIYLGVCPIDYEYEEKQLAIMQQKILSLGEYKLKKFVCRMKFLGNANELSKNLSSLEYLRIDGCENVSVINDLLDCMPNLKSCRLSLLQPVRVKSTQHQVMRQCNRNSSLSKLTIRVDDLSLVKELTPIFVQHGSDLKNLIIYLNPIRESDSSDVMQDVALIKLQQWLTTAAQQLLPQLANFHLRQRVFSRNLEFVNQPCYFTPYIKAVPYASSHTSYQAFIATHLTTMWQNQT